MNALKEIVNSCNRAIFLGFLLLSSFPANAETWTLRTWDELLNYDSASHLMTYTPLERAAKRWRLCALYPHLKDSYWLSVNYGMVDQARKLGVDLHVYEAGGYHQEAQQALQLRECADQSVDAIILGTVTFSGHSDLLLEISKSTPVVGLVNNIDPDGITAMAGVNWREMGRISGDYLAKRHPAGSAPVRIAWFPGANKEGISSTKISAFRDALKASAVTIVNTQYGDTGKMVQLSLLEKVLKNTRDLDYVVGTGVTAEVAIGAIRRHDLAEDTRILSGYFTHGVYRGIRRGKILASPTDQPVLQGRLSVDLAVRALEKRSHPKHAGPEILLVTGENLSELPRQHSLSPAFFKPTFQVGARNGE